MSNGGAVADQPGGDQLQRPWPAATTQTHPRPLCRKGLPLHCRAGPLNDVRTGTVVPHLYT